LTVFYEGIAQHLRPWRAQTEVGREESAELADNDGDERPASDEASTQRESFTPSGRVATRTGEIDGRAFAIFADGSIEIETIRGIQRFRSFAELNAAAAALNGDAR
jgi:hypothetical protein